MSTKCTIMLDEYDNHLYRDMADGKYYLRTKYYVVVIPKSLGEMMEDKK